LPIEQKGWWPDILEMNIGVKLDFIPAGDQGEQKLQALMAGGELPDTTVFTTQKQVEDAVKADMLVNPDNQLDKLPNVLKMPDRPFNSIGIRQATVRAKLMLFRENVESRAGMSRAQADGSRILPRCGRVNEPDLVRAEFNVGGSLGEAV
jgi:hypothetical protein